ncbi:hypothetical protein ACH5RR_006907 [Cinchona calisaya]|uniref:Uncharacterized protein n=1 Tax=Cinchona calisaya TaxID=153742 RepID=A0ABD3AQA9_9GENT
MASGLLCDHKIPLRLKGKFYRTVIRPAILYESECWVVNHTHKQKMRVAEMQMLRWMCGYTKMDKIRNEHICEKIGVASIDEKMRETRLRCLGHVLRRPVEAPVRRVDFRESSQHKRGRGKPKKIWWVTYKKDIAHLRIEEDMVHDRTQWCNRIHAADST